MDALFVGACLNQLRIVYWIVFICKIVIPYNNHIKIKDAMMSIKGFSNANANAIRRFEANEGPH